MRANDNLAGKRALGVRPLKYQPKPIAITPYAAFNAGLEALEEGTEEQALPLVEAAIKQHPGEAGLLQIAGLLYHSLEDLEPAIDRLQQAAKLAPSDVKIAHALALAWTEAGRPRPELFDKVAVLAPADLSVVRSKAASLANAGEPLQASALLRATLRQHPLWIDGHRLLAQLYSTLENPERATQSFQEAIAKQPDQTELWAGLIATLIHAQRHAEAIQVIGKAEQFLGWERWLEAHRAACLDELGETKAASASFDRLQPITEAGPAICLIRHHLRCGEVASAQQLAEHHIRSEQAHKFWPYVATAWRLSGDPRWNWLEGDERLIGIYDIGKRTGSLKELAVTLRKLHVSVNQPLEQSLRGGTQTYDKLLPRVDPAIRRLRKAIVETVRKHIAQLPPVDPDHPTLRHRREAPVRFAGSWSVRLTDAGFHVNHVHPKGWFSSAFYVSIPDEAARGAAPAGWLAIGQPPAELGIALEPFKLIEPKAGRLVLFPSTTWHGTVPFGEGERLSVAFDVAAPKPA